MTQLKTTCVDWEKSSLPELEALQGWKTVF